MYTNVKGKRYVISAKKKAYLEYNLDY